MNIKVRVYGSIGPIRIGLENQEDSLKRDIAMVEIPDADLAAVTEALLTRCYQQNFMTPCLWDICNVINEGKRPTVASGPQDQASL